MRRVLSVALINAVVSPKLRYDEQAVPVIERYRRRFRIRRLRTDRSRLPHVEEQETLNDLINHYGFAAVPLPTHTALLGHAEIETSAIYANAIGAAARQPVSRMWL